MPAPKTANGSARGSLVNHPSKNSFEHLGEMLAWIAVPDHQDAYSLHKTKGRVRGRADQPGSASTRSLFLSLS
jgi:hypothetical protein